MKLLVVDDNPTNRMLVTMMLEDEPGIACDEAESGQEALIKVAGGNVDIMLLDISMPDMGGEEVCRRIKADPALPKPRIVAYTAHVMPQEIASIMQAGFDGFLNKPFTREDLLKSLLLS